MHAITPETQLKQVKPRLL